MKLTELRGLRCDRTAELPELRLARTTELLELRLSKVAGLAELRPSKAAELPELRPGRGRSPESSNSPERCLAQGRMGCGGGDTTGGQRLDALTQ